jgi:hypothetical protein
MSGPDSATRFQCVMSEPGPTTRCQRVMSGPVSATCCQCVMSGPGPTTRCQRVMSGPVSATCCQCVMAGLGPATHVFTLHRRQTNLTNKSSLATIGRTFQAGLCVPVPGAGMQRGISFTTDANPVSDPICVMAGLCPATHVFTLHRRQANPTNKSSLATARRTFRAEMWIHAHRAGPHLIRRPHDHPAAPTRRPD